MTIKGFMQRHSRLAATIGAGSAILVGGAAAVATHQPATKPASKEEIELVVRDYILTHPEIIPQAMEKLRDQRSQSSYATHKEALETPFASAWAGAENGDVTLVMFSDFACGYCRTSLDDLNRLLDDDPRLKVVWREIPILGPGSEIAAKASLAAARQGKFREFHERMFATGQPDGDKVSAVLRGMKLDLRRAERDIYGPEVMAELRKNLELVAKLDDSPATPTFVVNGQILKGAVGYDALKQAVGDARKRI